MPNVSPWMIYLTSHAILCLIPGWLFVFVGALSSEDESIVCLWWHHRCQGLELEGICTGRGPAAGLLSWAFWEGQTLCFKLGLDLQGPVWPVCKDCLGWGGVLFMPLPLYLLSLSPSRGHRDYLEVPLHSIGRAPWASSPMGSVLGVRRCWPLRPRHSLPLAAAPQKPHPPASDPLLVSST